MRRPDRPVRVAAGPEGRPHHFWWRGRRYGPLGVEDEWAYAEPWWEGEAARERRFYRVVEPSGARFDLCRDPSGIWRLYRVFD